MRTKRSGNLIFKLIFLVVVTCLFASCKIIRIEKESLIGNTSIERKFDENGVLIYYKKNNVKHQGYRYRPHMVSITRVKTKIFEDHKLTVFYFEKSIRSISKDGKILKSKRVVWDEHRKKTVTRTPAK